MIIELCEWNKCNYLDTYRVLIKFETDVSQSVSLYVNVHFIIVRAVVPFILFIIRFWT